MEIRAATWDDLAEAVDLLGVQSRAASGSSAIRLEFVRQEWGSPGFEVGRDNVVAVQDGLVVGYAAVSPARELAIVGPGPGVEDALLDRLEAHARERGIPDLRVTVVSPDDPRSTFVRRRGFRLEVETLLLWCRVTRELEPPVWPPGVSVRTFAPGDAQAVHALLDEAYRAWDRHYVPVACDVWVRGMTGDIEFDPTVWWLAERDGVLVGCALHWPSGWLKDIAVRAAERGRGLGTALVRQGLVELGRRGVARVGLKVDAGNPTGALALYERLGFEVERREALWVRSL